MGRHVDTTRGVDETNYDRLARWERELLTRVPTPSQAHRKPGEAISRAGFTASQVEGYRQWRDSWSGNADTDKAWRVPDYNMYG